jgi:hypothetical protein
MKNKVALTKNQQKTSKIPPQKNKQSLFDKVDIFLSQQLKLILLVIMLATLIFSFLLFNAKISEANDDALYIEAAFNFAKNFFGYYTAYAPLYPMLLSLIVKFLGINLFALKITSLIFSISHLYFLYLAFKGRVPLFVLLSVIVIAAINCYFLYYSSMTFTEQFFLMLQAVFLYVFFKAFDNSNVANDSKTNIKLWILPGFVLFVLTMTRNLSIGVLIPAFLFFVWCRQPKQILYFLFGFLMFRIPFEFIRKLLWGAQNQFSNQMSVLIMQKNPYDPSKGLEDFSGFIDRFTGNYGLYISKRFFQILGFIPEGDFTIRPGLGFVFFLFFLFSFVVILRSKNLPLIFTFLYTSCLVCFTFLSLQTSWDQYRFILVFVPLILILIFYSIYFVFKTQSGFLQALLISFILVLIFSSLFSTINKSIQNYPIVKRNFSGDIFYGYTPDWENYLKMSKYCGDSLPKETFIACRKSPMSFIYANGKEFYPVYTVFSSDPDSILNTFKENKVTHIILASLRRNPKKNDGYVINTINRLLQPVVQKYPNKLSLVKQIGESEPAYLYKINY